LKTAAAESPSATLGSRGGAVISRRRAPTLSRFVLSISATAADAHSRNALVKQQGGELQLRRVPAFYSGHCSTVPIGRFEASVTPKAGKSGSVARPVRVVATITGRENGSQSWPGAGTVG
jgi:hypothetical protein